MPDRSLLLLLSTFIAIAAGLGAAYAKSQLHRSFASADILARETGMPVLAAVPALHFPANILSARRATRAYQCAILGLTMILLGLLVVERIQQGGL